MHPTLRRELGVFGATMMGLGSIVGTGVFVSIAIAAGIAGPATLIAIAIAAFVATANALSSAQLAASHPVSGGTYEYGYKYLTPTLGFTAGWMFLCAKSASAATAALGFAGYLLNLLQIQHGRPLLVLIAVIIILALTAVTVTGIRQSNRANIAIVSITLLSLLVFIVAGLPPAIERARTTLTNFSGTNAADNFLSALLHATALMFVAYTGYGRIATLGEEVHHPRRTIPRAIIVTLVVSALLYIAVAFTAIATVGAAGLASSARSQAAPLEYAARQFPFPAIAYVVALGAMTAMLGVLHNLLLGLSRVLLAMGRRRDMPPITARLNTAGTTPYVAVLVIAAVILALALIGNVKTTWSFSAFTVLIYYALTNLAALKLPSDQRMFPRWIAWCGLLACLLLAFAVELRIWLIGLLILAIGLLWHAIAHRLQSKLPVT